MSEQKKVELHLVHTSCKDCVFAAYEGKTQTACAFWHRVKRFADEGAVVEAYDEEKEFFIINGRRCLAYRNTGWGQHYKSSEWHAKVREELRQKVDIVVPLTGEVDGPALRRTIDSLRQLRMKPNALHVISNQDSIPIPKLHAVLTIATRDLPFPYYLTSIVERQADGSRPPELRAIDLTASKLKGHFYGVFHPGAIVPPDYVAAIDSEVVERLARFVVLLPDANGNGLTVALGFHKNSLIQGNKPILASAFEDEDNPTAGCSTLLLNSVGEKALYLASSKKMPFLVACMETVCRPE